MTTLLRLMLVLAVIAVIAFLLGGVVASHLPTTPVPSPTRH